MKKFKLILLVIITSIIILGIYFINKNEINKIQLSEQQLSSIHKNTLNDRLTLKENNQVKTENLLSSKKCEKKEVNSIKVDSITSATKLKQNKLLNKQERAIDKQDKVLVNKNKYNKLDAITSATKNNKDIPSNNKGNGNKTISNTNNIAYNCNSSNVINTKNIFQVIDREHSCINEY